MLVTNGGKHAVYNTFAHAARTRATRSCCRRRTGPPTPSRSRLAGGVPVVLPTDETDRLPGHRRPARGGPHRAHQGARVRVALEPDGRRVPADEVEAIGRWAVEHGIWVVTDEIYEHLTYGDTEFTSMPALVPELADRCVVLNGVAKTYAMTGWRVGWMIGPADVVKAATNLQSHSTSNVANVVPARRARRGVRRPRRRRRDARGVRPAGPASSTGC